MLAIREKIFPIYFPTTTCYLKLIALGRGRAGRPRRKDPRSMSTLRRHQTIPASQNSRSRPIPSLGRVSGFARCDPFLRNYSLRAGALQPYISCRATSTRPRATRPSYSLRPGAVPIVRKQFLATSHPPLTTCFSSTSANYFRKPCIFNNIHKNREGVPPTQQPDRPENPEERSRGLEARSPLRKICGKFLRTKFIQSAYNRLDFPGWVADHIQF